MASTVSHYRRWLSTIGHQELSAYVERGGHRSVKEGKVFFCEAWKQLDRRITSSSRRSKRF
ncbi:uncharacterized protein MELLADRAFT_93879 [Melampsora larici-populina 98AG31]|uniref:Uncharacterized protein n=1 Tax=Melampsora larici-populina (strain 98AG31 / pathotype 3-4-7) TaxID=747676 RepID=F4S5L3_MELLP|nr:uncharacterized protein MELLADRAFT_93879 [Melampsora larici-populina 98AG31]EGG00048.1 hypothetical protein MELLADRAFT_93879 [Melampsora larici-populina 98AG31]